MSAANYVLCEGCDRKVFYIGEEDWPEGAIAVCADCVPSRWVEPGATSRVEWGYRPADGIDYSMSRQYAWPHDEAVARKLAAFAQCPVMSRTVHEGPWRPAEEVVPGR